MKISKDVKEDMTVLRLEGLTKGVCETYGNFIRRTVMLASGGWRVSSIRINRGRVTSQFDVVEGLLEDCLELIANINKVEFSMEGNDGDSVLVNYSSKEGTSVITSKELFRDHPDLALVNENIVIGNLIEGKSVSIDMNITYGIGTVQEIQNNLKLRDAVDESDLKGYMIFRTMHRGGGSDCYYTIDETSNEPILEIVFKGEPTGVRREVQSSGVRALMELKEIITTV